MPKMYRVMKRDGSRPQLGAQGSMLGVRPNYDVTVDKNGFVHRREQGMSVGPSLAALPFFLIPERLSHLKPAAEGNNKSFVWSLGSGKFENAEVAANLVLNVDTTDHGVVAPAAKMLLQDFQEALWATAPQWIIDES